MKRSNLALETSKLGAYTILALFNTMRLAMLLRSAQMIGQRIQLQTCIACMCVCLFFQVESCSSLPPSARGQMPACVRPRCGTHVGSLFCLSCLASLRVRPRDLEAEASETCAPSPSTVSRSRPKLDTSVTQSLCIQCVTQCKLRLTRLTMVARRQFWEQSLPTEFFIAISRRLGCNPLRITRIGTARFGQQSPKP